MLDYILPEFFVDEKARMSLEPLVQEGAQNGALCHSRSCSPTTGFQNPAFRTDVVRGRVAGDSGRGAGALRSRAPGNARLQQACGQTAARRSLAFAAQPHLHRSSRPRSRALRLGRRRAS
ncbi:hypothetical protein HPB51_016142 [Rhipicephalus microplus]|uniref:Uncharacterized protein n=1 Tax=Rhipicephalus microplus TaxID=6941 RepID=A0A9J6DAQ6_RHIMP|nr:hypothetical protein HPB51_016142 [Rhipicephalus microplus]